MMRSKCISIIFPRHIQHSTAIILSQSKVICLTVLPSNAIFFEVFLKIPKILFTWLKAIHVSLGIFIKRVNRKTSDMGSNVKDNWLRHFWQDVKRIFIPRHYNRNFLTICHSPSSYHLLTSIEFIYNLAVKHTQIIRQENMNVFYRSC